MLLSSFMIYESGFVLSNGEREREREFQWHSIYTSDSWKSKNFKIIISRFQKFKIYLDFKDCLTYDHIFIFQPQNILFTKPFPHGDIKVCDLGFACLVNTGEDIRDIIGTPDYVGKWCDHPTRVCPPPTLHLWLTLPLGFINLVHPIQYGQYRLVRASLIN